MNYIGTKISTFIVGLLSYLIISTACCDDVMKLWAFAGHYSLSECQTLAKNHENPQSVILVCPGDDVTLFWYSSANQVDIDQGIGRKNSPDVAYPVISSNTTFKASPVNNCAASAEVSVMVVDKPTESTHIAKWHPQCAKMGFEVEEIYYSKNLVAVSIFPNWEFLDGSGIVCSPDPTYGILHMNHMENFFNQYIMDYKAKEKIQNDSLSAVGHWFFVPKWQCAAHTDCDPTQSFPFKLILKCK